MQKTIRAGISSACFFPQETADAVKKLCGWNIPNIEIFLNSLSELEDGYIFALRDMCKTAGVKVSSVHPFTSGTEPMFFFSEYPGRFSDGVKIYRKFFHAAQVLGADMIVFHGDAPYSKLPLEKGFEQLRVMDKIAREEYGVFIAYENVVRCKGQDPEYFVKLKEYYPDMRFVLDTKQARLSGHDPLDYLNKLGSSIAHIHISDSDDGHFCMPLGKGNADIQSFLRRLKEINFTGCIVQELYNDSYLDEQEVLDGYLLLERLLKK